MATSHPLATTSRAWRAAQRRQRCRRRARSGRGAHRRGADGQRRGRGRVRPGVARRRAPRAERLRPLAGGDRRAACRRVRPALGHGPRRRSGVGRPGGAFRPAGARRGAGAGDRPCSARRGVHGANRAQVGARRASTVAGASSLFALSDPGAGADAAPDRRPRPRCRSTTAICAASIAAATWLSESDLAAHRSEWVEPLRFDYRGVEVCELPPNGQGAAALLALALYDGLEPGAAHADRGDEARALRRLRGRCTTARCLRTSSPREAGATFGRC